MSTTRPSLELLRELSDEHVLTAVMDRRRLTRAELAAITGISKPTVGESVRRLVSAGVLIDTGERTRARGGVGSYYALTQDAGNALAMSIDPSGVAAEIVDAYGTVLARRTATVPRPLGPARAAAALRTTGRRLRAATSTPIRTAVVSAADPVDRRTGALVHLPDAPFLLGEMSVERALQGVVDGPVIVDNDVNWAARAERAAAPPGTMDDFVYLYLAEGLGCAVVSDGEVRRGHTGLAGEISHIVVPDRSGRAAPFIELFGQLGMRYPGSTAIDVSALTAAVQGTGRTTLGTRRLLGDAVAAVIAAVVALSEPSVVVIGGSWGSHPLVLDAVDASCERMRHRAPIRATEITSEAPLAGARSQALAEVRRLITDYRHTFVVGATESGTIG